MAAPLPGRHHAASSNSENCASHRRTDLASHRLDHAVDKVVRAGPAVAAYFPTLPPGILCIPLNRNARYRPTCRAVAPRYLPADERNIARLLRLIELTEARDVQPKLSPATSRDERATIARQSFRPAVRKLCGFLRAWADGPGRISIERDPNRYSGERQIAIVRPRRSLHPSFTDNRVLLIDATGNIDDVRQLLPDAVEIAPPAARGAASDPGSFPDGASRQARYA